MLSSECDEYYMSVQVGREGRKEERGGGGGDDDDDDVMVQEEASMYLIELNSSKYTIKITQQ
jgi:hypothetical protein